MNSSLIMNSSASMNSSNSTFTSTLNNSLLNNTYSEQDEKDIVEILPFIIMGAFLICVFIGLCIVWYKDSKHQINYVNTVKARKIGEVVQWV
jgi:hypothetical protein